jgi:hypothetical protein
VLRRNPLIILFCCIFGTTKGNLMQTSGIEYVAPTIEDHGDLAELTAGNATGEYTDKAFPTHTLQKDLTFSGP